jgi:arginine decarboxylase
MSRNSTNEPNRLIGAAVGVALPKDQSNYGYISEHHCFGVTSKKLEDYTEDLAATMLATTLGLEFDPDKAWDKRKQEYKMSRQIVRTQSVAQTAEGDKDGLWTTVIAAAVFLEE